MAREGVAIAASNFLSEAAVLGIRIRLDPDLFSDPEILTGSRSANTATGPGSVLVKMLGINQEK
jgi:hypothetical protein